MANIENTAESWEDIRREFSTMRDLLVPYRVCSPDDLKRHQLSVLTYGQIESPFEERMRSGDWVYSNDSERRELLETVAFQLGFPRAERPGNWPPFFSDPRRLNWQLLERSIEAESATPSFILEWGRLCEIVGYYLELVYLSKRYADEVGQGLAGKLDSSIIAKQYWYAYWIRANSASLNPRDRTQAEDDLTEVCVAIKDSELPPHRPYPRDWFASMLEEGDETLKLSYTRISVSKLTGLLADPLITAAALPPLRAAEFRRR